MITVVLLRLENTRKAMNEYQTALLQRDYSHSDEDSQIAEEAKGKLIKELIGLMGSITDLLTIIIDSDAVC